MNQNKRSFAERVERMQTVVEHLLAIDTTLSLVREIVAEEANEMQQAALRFAAKKSSPRREKPE